MGREAWDGGVDWWVLCRSFGRFSSSFVLLTYFLGVPVGQISTQRVGNRTLRSTRPSASSSLSLPLLPAHTSSLPFPFPSLNCSGASHPPYLFNGPSAQANQIATVNALVALVRATHKIDNVVGLELLNEPQPNPALVGWQKSTIRRLREEMGGGGDYAL